MTFFLLLLLVVEVFSRMPNKTVHNFLKIVLFLSTDV